MKFVVRTLVFAAAALTLATSVAEAQRGPGGGFGGGRGGSLRPGRPGPGIPGGGSGGWGRPSYPRGGGWHRGPIYGGGTVYYPGGYPGRVCGWDQYCGTTYVGGSGSVSCSPESFEGNVSKTDKVLKALASSSDFAKASSFKSQVSKIVAMKDAAAKATAYLNLAGIDSNDSKAIVAFVGARDAKGAWITDLQRNSDLSNAQAERVATSLQNALRGNLQ